MASVHLDFIPPDHEDVTQLIIYESASPTGPWNIIETVATVGTYPNYITEYTTTAATSAQNWFSIEWKDSKGASFGQSQGVQGGAESLVSEIVDRVMLRDPSIKEEIAAQEAEAVVEKFYGTTDPLSKLASDATAQELSGLTLLTIVRSKLVTISQTSNAGYTAGLVSQTASSTASTSLDNLKALLEEANILLGLSFSVVLQLAEIDIAGGASLVSNDQSRLLVEFQ
jgi:hypothetical protein